MLLSLVRTCLCCYFYFDMVLLYGNVLLPHPRFQVYLSIFTGISFHSLPMSLLFLQLLHRLVCCFYKTNLPSPISCLVILANYHWQIRGGFGSHTFHSSRFQTWRYFSPHQQFFLHQEKFLSCRHLERILFCLFEKNDDVIKTT